jgi:hypothetical protein
LAFSSKYHPLTAEHGFDISIPASDTPLKEYQVSLAREETVAQKQKQPWGMVVLARIC